MAAYVDRSILELLTGMTDQLNLVLKFHEAILIGCQVTEGTPLCDYNATSAIFHPKGP